MLRRSLDYPENSAGRLMQTTMVAAPPFWTAGQTLDFIHDVAEDELPESFFEVFVVDPGHRFLGNVFLDALVRAETQTLDELDEICERHRVRPTEDGRGRAAFSSATISSPCRSSTKANGSSASSPSTTSSTSSRKRRKRSQGARRRARPEEADRRFLVDRAQPLPLAVRQTCSPLSSRRACSSMFEFRSKKWWRWRCWCRSSCSQGGNSATQTMTVAVRALATRELNRTNASRIILRELASGSSTGAASAS